MRRILRVNPTVPKLAELPVPSAVAESPSHEGTSTMDPLTLGAGVVAVAGIGAAGRMRRRARRAEVQADGLRRELQAERHAASHDALTGLPNRRAFYQLGSALVADPARYPLVAVMFDLDGFKDVNDSLGHAAGDEVLITAARRFAAFAGDNLVARLGGDEFAGLLTRHPLDGSGLHGVARALAIALAAPMCVTGHGVQVTASVGLVPVYHRDRLADILHQADGAMYHAKSAGGGVCLAARPDVAIRRDLVACHHLILHQDLAPPHGLALAPHCADTTYHAEYHAETAGPGRGH
jgi:diguanylate cyclase (GGDEF)-like protein